jgi:hypothetical protein
MPNLPRVMLRAPLRVVACDANQKNRSQGWGMTETPTDGFMPPSRLRDIAAAPAQWALRPRGSPAQYRVAADRCASD